MAKFENDVLTGLLDTADPSPLADYLNNEHIPIEGLTNMLNSNENHKLSNRYRQVEDIAPHTAVAQNDGNAILQQRRTSQQDPANPSFHQNPSPPSQTDSSTSAGSPSSGSDHSPCPNSEHVNHQGVIMGVQPQMHELQAPFVGFPNFNPNPYFSPHTSQQFGSLAQQPSPASVVSTGGLGSPPLAYWPPAQNIIDEHGNFANGERALKRARFPKPDPSSPRISEDGPDAYLDYNNPQQCIGFNQFEKEKWHSLCDHAGRPLQPFGFHVVADKGFNFSPFDTAFVNQKKNHFQVSVHIENNEMHPPMYILVRENGKDVHKPLHRMRVQEGNQWVERAEFRLSFYGVKSEMTSSKIAIRQSQTDRKPVDYEPVKLACPEAKVTKVTVARLHFSETTMNNQRKNGRPNPDQKYLNLAVVLQAVVNETEIYPVMAFASDKVIVRASNPGQFDNGESDVHWQKGQNGYGNYIYHTGSACIGTDKPQGENVLTVNGSIYYTGQPLHPSDKRYKENIEDVDTSDALKAIRNIRIVRYDIRPEFVEEWNLQDDQKSRVGVIAQELQETIPDAVRQNGEFLAVDDNRIFYEQTAAVQELHRLTEQLDYKVSEAHADVENINKKFRRLCRLKNLPSLRSTSSSHESGVNCSSTYLSRSLSTLAGDATPKNDRKQNPLDDPEIQFSANRRGKYHCHNTCQVGNSGLVNNRFVQWACILLVGIIAFCLIAMTTLYIMDWKSNRDLKEKTHMTFGTGTAPTDTSKSKGPDPGHMEMDVNNENGNWTPPDWDRPPPLLYPCADNNCDLFCCHKSSFKYLSNRNTATEPHIDDVALLSPPANTASSSQDRVKRRSQFEAPEMVDKTAQGQGVENLGKVGPVDIHVLGVNQTITRDYCTSKACNDPKGGNYTFYVPVSEYMPMISIQLMFDVRDKRTVSHCGGTKEEKCEEMKKGSNETPPINVVQGDGMHEGDSNVFLLPVGFYTRSHYKFRIGDSTTSCLAEPADVGQTYDEYNIIFYRVCQQ